MPKTRRKAKARAKERAKASRSRPKPRASRTSSTSRVALTVENGDEAGAEAGEEYLGSRFERVRELGAGSYGQVSLVRDRAADKLLVMKKLPKYKVDLHELMIELTALRRLKPICHEHLICYVGFFEDEEAYYLATDYLGDDWITLADYVEGGLGDEAERSAAIANGLVAGIVAIHRLGVAHRDIKPENVLINRRTDAVRYIDLDLACWAGSCEQFFTYGNSCFGAPELYAAYKKGMLGQPDPRFTLASYQAADLFAVGRVIVFLMTGQDDCDHRLSLRPIIRTLQEHHGPNLAGLLAPKPTQR